jgi:hypothetical protein
MPPTTGFSLTDSKGSPPVTSVTLFVDRRKPENAGRGSALKRLFMVAGAVVGLLVVWYFVSKKIPSHVEYRGEQIKLSRFYLDYDDYKNDPDNIDPSETSRVQRLVMDAPIGATLATNKEIVHAAFAIKFPGYGLGGLSDGRNGENSLDGFSIEIPRADKERYVTFRYESGKYVLIDDFVGPGMPLLTRVRQENNSLVYSSDLGSDRRDKVVRPLPGSGISNSH